MGRRYIFTMEVNKMGKKQWIVKETLKLKSSLYDHNIPTEIRATNFSWER